MVLFCQNLVNGKFGSDKGIGVPTCHKAKDGTVLDYVVVSDSLVPQINDFSVGIYDKTLSDFHCPLFFSIKSLICETDTPSDNSVEIPVHKPQHFTCKWQPGKNHEYKNSFSVENIEALSRKIDNLLDTENGTSQQDIDGLVSSLNSLFIETAKNVDLCKTPKQTTRKYTRKFPNKPWFDRE